mmetsp:Transcript_23307/g.51210  ORF Transcript_23307/g.51210 Transcript_23307/m.51210 type:complete len:663 (-) Transcript_23307:190-2178(-)|eukprot:CAMPEP_0206451666 /NCGR_PEP_ID=MMETSP0324_2-20121206/19479_1 /ASSEMBLY_ACC=CAM_ASM_000836 /TAXON_ID=2866 /ORGANISM="Crypthecodinium cohnii, Strain Seligo" /LENGTH=662 /DNA_ID=CAMNT_0053921595 /DNA_START=96 /DNA_END=2084 /DNA_ORIENTATION=-
MATKGKAEEEVQQGFLTVKTRTGTLPLHRVIMDNMQSGMTVALVSVPLSISLGIASISGDDPTAPAKGVATAFWGGITAGCFASSDLNIVGPAGALSGMLKSYTIEFGDSGVLPYLSVMSACITCLFWMLNVQRYLLLMPKAVFEGFTLAVAIVIGCNQINMAFDLKPPGPKKEHFHENFVESLKVLPELSPAPAVFFLVNVALLLLLVKYLPKVKGISVPWTVVVPIVSILAGYLSHEELLGGFSLPTLKSKYGTLEPQIFRLPEHPPTYYSSGKMGSLFSAAFGIAFVAILETLISAKIAEQKSGWAFSDSGETLGLALSHAVCGFVGALPPTGVFVRTSLNMQCGATHRISQVINAIMVFIISVAAMPIFSYLPQASVAALLVFASVRMAPIDYIAELWHSDRVSCALLCLTATVCVFSDPVYGLIVGMVIALLRDASETAAADARLTVSKPGDHSAASDCDISPDASPSSGLNGRSISTGTIIFDQAAKVTPSRSPISRAVKALKHKGGFAQLDQSVWSALPGSVVLYEPIGAVVYLASERHLARLKALAHQKPLAVVISLELTTRLDIDGCEVIGKAIDALHDVEIRVAVVLPDSLVATCLRQAKWFGALRRGGAVFAHRSEAINHCSDQDVELAVEQVPCENARLVQHSEAGMSSP